MWIPVLALMVFVNLYDGVKSSPLPADAVKTYTGASDIGNPDVHTEAITRNTTATGALAKFNFAEVNIVVGDGAYPEKSVIRISCNTNGRPIPAVLWYKDGKLFQPNDRTVFSGFKLIIIGAEKSDTGKYRCEADNEYTSDAETSDIAGDGVNIVVGNEVYPEESVIRITCNTYGRPIPAVLWYKDGNLLEPNDRIVFSGFKLIIIGADNTDTGKYRCGAANEYTSGAETSNIAGDAPNQSINTNRLWGIDQAAAKIRQPRSTVVSTTTVVGTGDVSVSTTVTTVTGNVAVATSVATSGGNVAVATAVANG